MWRYIHEWGGDPSRIHVAGHSAGGHLAAMVMDGTAVTDGMDLGLPGYNAIKLEGKVIYGQAFVTVTKDNMAEYPF